MSLRLLVTADLHYDVARSRASAEAVAREINQTPGDAVLLIGDAATADGEGLERCLGLFRDGRPRLFVPGNHELWSRASPKSAEMLLADELPARVRAAGWHWLPGAPFRLGDIAVVGSLGWYDYSFAEPRLAMPRRFYEAKLTPAAAALLGRTDLRPDGDDVPDVARGFVARWNDGRFISGIDDDAAFLARRLAKLRGDLAAVAGAASVIAAVHVAPFAEMLPPVPVEGTVPMEKRKYAFARAYLGSAAIGRESARCANVTHILCGHTHVARDEVIEGRRCINVGSTYTQKRVVVVEVA